VSDDTIADHLLARAEACIVVGRPEQALETIDRITDRLDSGRDVLAQSLRGIASVAIGRQHLQSARGALDASSIAPWVRGRVLPRGCRGGSRSVSRHTANLRSGRSDTGPERSRSQSKPPRTRDLLRAGPSAELDSISALLESTAASDDFPRSLAALLTEAFGANAR
jgi:hypothetical protein